MLGCELSQQYTEEGSRRLAAVQPGDALVGPENPLTSAPATATGRRLDELQQGQAAGTRRKKLVKKKPPALFDE